MELKMAESSRDAAVQRCRHAEDERDDIQEHLVMERQRTTELERHREDLQASVRETEALRADLQRKLAEKQTNQADKVMRELEGLRRVRDELASREKQLQKDLREARDKKKAYKSLLLAYEEEIWRLRGQIEGMQRGGMVAHGSQLRARAGGEAASVATPQAEPGMGNGRGDLRTEMGHGHGTVPPATLPVPHTPKPGGGL